MNLCLGDLNPNDTFMFVNDYSKDRWTVLNDPVTWKTYLKNDGRKFCIKCIDYLDKSPKDFIQTIYAFAEECEVTNIRRARI